MRESAASNIVVITGTDTAVGKTMVGAGLARALLDRGVAVVAVKPVESGTSAQPNESEDGVILAAATGQTAPRQALTRLRAPLAPPVAAVEQGIRLDMNAWCAEIETYTTAVDIALVEGAGGVLSPLTWNETTRDLARRLGARAVLVATDRLGTLNHTLMALEALEHAGVSTAAVVFSTPDAADLSTGRNAEALHVFSGFDKIAVLPRVSSFRAAADRLGKVAEWLVTPRASRSSG
jgi:dethiobiotin synthetase